MNATRLLWLEAAQYKDSDTRLIVKCRAIVPCNTGYGKGEKGGGGGGLGVKGER